MKKLMFAVAVAALAQVGFGSYDWINQSCDIATTSQLDTSRSQYFLCQRGVNTYTLSKDFTLTHAQFYAQSVLQGDNYWYARCVYDFRNGNHVLTVNPGFFTYGKAAAGTKDPDHQDDIYASHEFLGGTWDMNGKSLYFGCANDVHQCDHMVIIADGTTFRNISETTLLEKTFDSKVTFKNGAMLGNESDRGTSVVTVYKPHNGIDDNNEVRFESGAKMNCLYFRDSYAPKISDAAILSKDWNLKTVITGDGTELNVNGETHFSECLGGITTIIDDKSVFNGAPKTYAVVFGGNLNARNGTLIIDNGAKLNCCDFKMGTTSRMMENMTLKIGNGAELHISNQFMSAGKGNSLEIDNGTLKADGASAFYLGFQSGDIVSSDYSLTLKGKNPRIISNGDTQIRHSHVTIELVPGQTYTEPFITGKRQVFIATGSTVELKNAMEYCQQLTAPVDIPLLHDAEAKSAYMGGDEKLIGFPDGAKLQRNATGNYVYLHLEPFSMKVGDKLFATFGAAAAAAEAGGTIEMIRDAEISEVGVFGTKDNLTLDLAGHTLTDTAQYFQFNKNAATTVTIASSVAGGKFKLAGGNWMTGWQGGTAGSTVIIEEGVTVDLGKNSIFEGHVYDNQLVHVKKGATITSDPTGGSCIYVGYSGSYNTLLIEGAVDVNSLLLGHPKEGTGDPTYGAKIIIRGQDAVVNERAAQVYPMTGVFGCANGEIIYDNCTIVSQKDFYWHSTNTLHTGNQLKLINGAKVKYADIWMGREGSSQEPCVPAIGQSIYIGEGCTLEVGTQLMMTGYGNTLTIDNGTFLAGSMYAFYWGHTSAQTTCEIKDNALVITGPKAKLRSTDSDNAQFYINGSTVTFDLSKGIYEEAPIKGRSLEIHDSNEVVFTGLEAVYAYLNEQGLESVDIPLMQSSTATMCYFFSNDKRKALNESLPAGVEVVVNNDATAVFLRVQLPGFSYELPFTSFEAYNAAVPKMSETDPEKLAKYEALYMGKDLYVVIDGVTFVEGVDYSFNRQYVGSKPASLTQPKLHIFFKNCKFPGGAKGTMSPDKEYGSDPADPQKNRKEIALCSAKEVVIEGCTFAAYTGDSYVIDINVFNWFDCEDCGITIKDNVFEVGAGNRTPISVKNKIGYPPAFVEITGNTFKGTPTANVICYGDQSGSATTNGGANFPITIENNIFEEGAKDYKVMTGLYVASSKETILVPVEKPFKWYYNARRGEWTAKPAFHQRVGTMIEVK